MSASIQDDTARCQGAPGTGVDAAIAALVLDTLTPLTLDLALSIQTELTGRAVDADRLRASHVERARHRAEGAHRGRGSSRARPLRKATSSSAERASPRSPRSWSVRPGSRCSYVCRRTAKAVTVRDAVVAKIVELPEQLRRSLTWDQGKEKAEHLSFSVATDVSGYFCDPHAPWQGGTNENTNGLLRQYLPRGLDRSTVTEPQLDAIAAELNERPRQTLGRMTPSAKFSELVAMAA